MRNAPRPRALSRAARPVIERLERRRLLAAGDLVESFGDGGLSVPEVAGGATFEDELYREPKIDSSGDGGFWSYTLGSEFYDDDFSTYATRIAPDGSASEAFVFGGNIDGTDPTQATFHQRPEVARTWLTTTVLNDIDRVPAYGSTSPIDAEAGRDFDGELQWPVPRANREFGRLGGNTIALLPDGTLTAVWVEYLSDVASDPFDAPDGAAIYRPRIDRFAADGSHLETRLLGPAVESIAETFAPFRVAADGLGRVYAFGSGDVGAGDRGEHVRRFVGTDLDATYGQDGLSVELPDVDPLAFRITERYHLGAAGASYFYVGGRLVTLAADGETVYEDAVTIPDGVPEGFGAPAADGTGRDGLRFDVTEAGVPVFADDLNYYGATGAWGVLVLPGLSHDAAADPTLPPLYREYLADYAGQAAADAPAGLRYDPVGRTYDVAVSGGDLIVAGELAVDSPGDPYDEAGVSLRAYSAGYLRIDLDGYGTVGSDPAAGGVVTRGPDPQRRYDDVYGGDEIALPLLPVDRFDGGYRPLAAAAGPGGTTYVLAALYEDPGRPAGATGPDVLLRVNPDGSPDSSFGLAGVVSVRSALAFDPVLLVDADGGVTVASDGFEVDERSGNPIRRELAYLRFDADGERVGRVFDGDFDGFSSPAALPGGGFVQAVFAREADGRDALDLRRYAPDGTVLLDRRLWTGESEDVNLQFFDAAVDAEGRAYVAATITGDVDGNTTRNYDLLRYRVGADGEVDPGYGSADSARSR